MAEQPGLITTEQAVQLLLLDNAEALKPLVKGGFITPEGKDRWRLVNLVQGYVRWQRHNERIVPTETLASTWGVTRTRVQQLANDGWFKQKEGPRGFYDWREATLGFAKYMRSEDRRSTKSAADVRIKDARAAEIEVRTAERLGWLIHIDIHREILDGVIGVFRAGLSGLPARITRDLVERRHIEREVHGLLSRISDHAKAQALKLVESVGANGAVADHITGRVGGKQPDVPEIFSDTGTA